MNWIVTAFIGVLAFILSFCFTIVNNTWLTSLFRAAIGFVVFFILGCIVQIILKLIMSRAADSNIRLKQEPGVNGDVNFSSLAEAEHGNPAGETSNDGEEPEFQSVSLSSLHNGKDSQ